MTDPVLSTVPLGVPGVHIAPGDHLCAFYRGLAERDEILIPFLRHGLQRGDKCICVVDATDPETVLAALAAGDDDATLLGDGRLEVHGSRETYLRGGRFSTGSMLTFWEDALDSAVAGGYAFTRAVGEMTWSMQDMPGVDELITYESQLNQFLPRYPQVILCLYDLERFSGNILMDVLKTHPKVLVGGMLVANPFYLHADEFLAGRQ
jgi:hypothetical protein